MTHRHRLFSAFFGSLLAFASLISSTSCLDSAVKFTRSPAVHLGESKQLVGHDEPVHAVAFSPDGKRLLSACGHPGIVNGKPYKPADTSIRLWDLDAGREILRLMDHTELISGVAFSPDGRRAVSGSYDETMRLWDLDAGKCIRVFGGHKAIVTCVGFFPDGQRAYSAAGGSIRIWDVDTGTQELQLGSQPRAISSVVVSDDGKKMLAGGNGGQAWLWEFQLPDPFNGYHDATYQQTTFPRRQRVLSVALAPDAKSCLVTSPHEPILLWDAATAAVVREFAGHRAYEVHCSNFTPDGKRFLSGGGDRTMRLWDATTGAEIKTWTGFPDGLNCVTVSPDGKWAASAGGGRYPESLDYTIRIWELPQ